MALGAVVCLLFAEIVCQCLPVSTSTATGYYFDRNLLTYPPHHAWSVATGWDLRNAQHLRSNNVGFAAHRDFVRDENAVALIGDSFVEASMLAEPDRPGAQLERALGARRPVYAMGSPGTSLLDYAERIRFAHQSFGVRDFVILMERGDVRQSLCGSGNNQAPCLDRRTLEPRIERQPRPSLAKRMLRHSAFAQYVFGQLKLDPAARLQMAWDRLRSAFSSPASTADGTSADDPAQRTPPNRTIIETVSRLFFERIRPYATGRLVIVIDSDRAGIEAGKPTTDPERDHFMELARAAGARVVDTEPLFRAHASRSPLRLEVGPYDGHLNQLAVNIVACAAAHALGRVAPSADRVTGIDPISGCPPI